MQRKVAAAWFVGVIVSLCILLIMLITAFEVGAYSDFKFYEKEYEKYDVLKDVKMQMPDVMYVTKEMMAYLKGSRDNLIVTTTVNGAEREFFNEREIAHMEDVRDLFAAGLELRLKAGILVLAILLAARILKLPWKTVLPRAYQYTTIGLGIVTAVLAGLAAADFTKYFTKFHEMFFTNDLWLLNPDTDLLINILPEGFFIDMASRIGIIFGGFLVLGFLAAAYARVRIRSAKKPVQSAG